jgi:hypothetical protein
MRHWRDRQQGLFARDGLTRSLMEIHGLSEGRARQLVAEMAADNLPIGRVYAELQQGLGARRLLDKSPAYALDPWTLSRAEETFERPRYVLLTRHPAAVIESFVRHRMEALLAPAGGVDDPWSFAEEVWRRANRNLLGLEARHGERCHRLRYEDLVRAPEAAMLRLVAFLDLPWDEAVLAPYAGGRMIDGPGDPDIFQQDGIDATLADAWRTALLPRSLAPETIELAERLGYAADTAGRGSSAGRAAAPDTAARAGELLSRVDELSDEEVAAALGALLDDEAEPRR